MKMKGPTENIPGTPRQESSVDREELQRILEYVQRELPRTEQRIPDPMRAACKVAIAIPSFQEGSEIRVNAKNGRLKMLHCGSSTSQCSYKIQSCVKKRQNLSQLWITRGKEKWNTTGCATVRMRCL